MNCLFCKSSEIEPTVIPRKTYFNNKIFSYSRCKNCALVFIDPLPVEDDYAIMYSSKYHEDFYFNDCIPDYSDLLQNILPYKTDATILDYGCGDGSFLKFFQKNNFKCTGTEFTSDLVKNLKIKNDGIEFFGIDEFWDKNESNTYNFIHLGDVLEHLTAPEEMIQKLCKRLNSEGGIIIFRGPLEDNASFGFMCRYATSWIQQKLNPTSVATHVPYHISFADINNQEILFKRAGLEKLHYKVWETPWPYPESAEGGLGTKIKYVLGQISVFLVKKFSTKHGNRFLYIGRIR